MDHSDHVALIRGGVEGGGTRWLELGAGSGAFTLALLDLLGEQADIVAIDRDVAALRKLVTATARQFPPSSVARSSPTSRGHCRSSRSRSMAC